MLSRLTPRGSAGDALLALRRVDYAPEEVEPLIWLDGNEMHRQPLRPDYGLAEPNGVGCGLRDAAEVRVEGIESASPVARQRWRVAPQP